MEEVMGGEVESDAVRRCREEIDRGVKAGERRMDGGLSDGSR